MTKINKSILVVGTYPIKNPRHGGQKRLDAIVAAYDKVFKNVAYTSVFYEGFYSDYGQNDILLGPEGVRAVERSPMTGDIVCGESIYTDPVVKAKFTTLLQRFRPDIIHIEQPFPYLGLKPLLGELSLSPKIVFGSQNIEAPMKREILENYNIPEDNIAKVEHDIHMLETELSKKADLTVACTQSDLKTHKAMGANNLVLAQNGVNEPAVNQDAAAYWRRVYKRMGVRKTALFVASAHPPNWAGFLKMVGKGLGFVPYDSRIVGAGSVCDFFKSEVKPDSLDIADATFWLRAYAAGRLSEERLSAIIAVSDVILLPITEGGGSNLKTAEAIIADKKVVTTSHALRSFEWFKDFPNVWVADKPDAFRGAITEALLAEKQERTQDQQKLSKNVLWSYCLDEMVEEVAKL